MTGPQDVSRDIALTETINALAALIEGKTEQARRCVLAAMRAIGAADETDEAEVARMEGEGGPPVMVVER